MPRECSGCGLLHPDGVNLRQSMTGPKGLHSVEYCVSCGSPVEDNARGGEEDA